MQRQRAALLPHPVGQVKVLTLLYALDLPIEHELRAYFRRTWWAR